MDGKVSINIKIPGLNLIHNFLIPLDMSVASATELVIQMLCDEYPGVQNSRMKPHFLMQESSGKMLNSTCSCAQLKLADGEILVLI